MENKNQDYAEYLATHREYVQKAFDWLITNLPDIYDRALKQKEKFPAADIPSRGDPLCHDLSKLNDMEFTAYADRFRGSIFATFDRDYKYARLHHIHHNPHHWQYWILINDDGSTTPLEMPLYYILEMIADWWSYVLDTGDPFELFDWYVRHQDKMVLHKITRQNIEIILARINEAIDLERRERRQAAREALRTEEDTYSQKPTQREPERSDAEE